MTFPSIRIEGTILSGDLLARLESGELTGQRPRDFDLDGSAAVKDDLVRAWTHAQAFWRAFRDRLAALKPEATATSETRSLFAIPFLGLLGWSELEFSRGETVGDKSFPISHRLRSHGGFPVHIVGARESLDKKRTDGTGPRSSPHGMVQEYLNLTEHVFALVTNGRLLRLLRDSTRLVRLSYVEFDLDRMFGEDLFADFAVLYRLLHVSRLPKTPSQTPESLLEHYHQDSLASGERIRDGLSSAVKDSILKLADGFLNHPQNDALRELASSEWRVANGEQSGDTARHSPFATRLYQYLLRLVYRLLFLMVIEERDLVFAAGVDPRKRKLYYAHYSLARLRRLAEKRHLAEGRHHDAWDALRSTFRLFDETAAGRPLGLEPLGGDLFDSEALGPLADAALDNATLLACLYHLSLFRNPDTGHLIRVNYAALNVEEFGSVYQGLLEFEPIATPAFGVPALAGPASNDRKAPAISSTRPPEGGTPNRWTFSFAKGDERSRTGSHYTPDELVQPLLKHSLDHLIAEKLAEARTAVAKSSAAPKRSPSPPTQRSGVGGEGRGEVGTLNSQLPYSQLAEKALLSLRVADIACGSGHILLAAARRIGTELAVLRTGDDQPSPAAFREAVRDVIRHCIYGMDLNPLAVELCKVALWLEAHVPGQALSFLDHRIKCGNAIVGLAHRAELQRGIPDEAFKTLPGDDKDLATALRKQNKEERKGQQTLNFAGRVEADLHALDEAYRAFDQTPERGVADYRTRRDRYQQFRDNLRLRNLSLLADAQVAQFYLPKTPENRGKHVTHDTFSRWMEGLNPTGPGIAAAMTLAHRKRFGHWFIEFWDVMDAGGFDCILGNPPYLMNRKLSGTFGDAFLEWMKFEYAPAASVDLVTYFFRRIFDLLKPKGFMALISTNTIAQGAAREAGLDVIVDRGGTINFAIRSQSWPGQAAVAVSVLTIFKGTWRGAFVLNGKQVARITTYLDDAELLGDPSPLNENIDRSFIGSYVLGKGFLLQPDQAADLMTREPKLKDVLFPYVSGDDFNSHPEQRGSRWAINFFDWPEERCRTEYPTPFAILEKKVKPERTRKDENGDFVLRKPLPQRWWIYADKRPKLYATIAGFERVLAAPLVSKYVNFAFVPRCQVFMHKLVVLAHQTFAAFAVFHSNLHDCWAWRYSSTLGTSTINYAPSGCFLTFPLPEANREWRVANGEASGDHSPLAIYHSLEHIGETYHEHRRALMRDLWLGLTDLYNLFHAPDLERRLEVLYEKRMASSAWRVAEKVPADHSPLTIYHSPAEACLGLQRLRDLHRELDQTVLTAYGWHAASDFGAVLDLRHGFYEVEYLPENDRTRYTIHPEARREVLARLLKLNHQRAAEQALASAKAKARKKPAPTVPADELPLGLDLFGRVTGPSQSP